MQKSLSIFNNGFFSAFFSFVFLYLRTFKNKILKSNRANDIRTLFLGFLGFLFILSIYFVFYRMLSYFLWHVPLLGSVLISQFVYMIFLTFFTMLIFSSIVVSISTIYLSEDLQLLISTPVSLAKVFALKFFESLTQSSWMVILLAIPILAAYGTVYKVDIMFFVMSISALIPFLVITSALGAFFTMILMRFFSAQKTRAIFMVLSVFFLCGIIILLRIIQPTRLTNPEAMLEVVNYITAIQTPTASFLPSHWVAKVVVASLKSQWHEAWIFTGLLFGVSAVLFVLLVLFSKYSFYKGWGKAQESSNIGKKKYKLRKLKIEHMYPFLPRISKAMILKDIKIFIRDANQWPQLLILSAIVIIYLFNIYYLPLQTLPSNMMATTLRSLTFFLNIGFVGFILSAVAARFVFPSVSMEGKSFWIIKSAPFSIKHFLWEKFWVSFFPMLIVSEILILTSNIIMKTDPFMTYLSLSTVFVMSIGLTALGVGMGAIYPKFEAVNVAEISTSTGGLFYMLWSLFYITIVLVAEAGPVSRHYFMNIMFKQSDWLPVIVHGSFIALITIAIVYIPMKLGEKALVKKEF